MADEPILECHIGLGFKSPDQSAQLLLQVIQQVGALTGFQGQETLEQILVSIGEPCVRLITARAIDRIEARSESMTVRLDLRFDESPDDHDETDLSILGLIPFETPILELWFFAHDPQFAQYIGFKEIERRASKQVPIYLSGLEHEKSEMGNAPSELVTDTLAGSNGNGNHPNV